VDLSSNISSIDNLVSKIDFIYSGDIIKSEKMKWVKKINHGSFSGIFFKEVIENIYEWSFNKMAKSSSDILIHNNYDIPITINYLEEVISNRNNSLMFYSNNTHSRLNIQLSFSFSSPKENNRYLDEWFYFKFKFLLNGSDVSSYYSPLISDSLDDCYIYLVDRPIQSLVWSLQNSKYTIDGDNHIIEMPVYHCDYNATRIRFVDTQKIREMKIKSILE
jgi:hypothetical protein